MSSGDGVGCYLVKIRKGAKMNRKRIPVLVLGIILLMNSCSIPRLAELTPTAMPIPTASPIPSPTLTATSTPMPAPMLSSSTELACHAGPGDLYDLIETLRVGESFEIVGRAEGFLIVKPSAGADCWVSNEQVNIDGEVSTLPLVDLPPTPVPTLPARPLYLGVIKQTCSIDYSTKPAMYVNEFWLRWTDMSNNEDGFRIYRDGDLVAEVPANKTDVIDVVIRRNSRVYNYYVTAYNEVGESRSDVKVFLCKK
jgi:hypothetical protein